jgi:hypothetical protein
VAENTYIQAKRWFGVKNLRKMNVSLLCKWWWALEREEGIWQDIVHLKYVKNSPTSTIPSRLSDSPRWCDLLKVRHIYLKGREVKIKNGKSVGFWLDPWIESIPLYQSYSVLYELALNKNSSVFEVKERDCVIPFRIRLQGVIHAQWYELAAKLNEVELCDDPDVVIWKWTKNKTFSVKSVYEHLTRDDRGSSYRRIWK